MIAPLKVSSNHSATSFLTAQVIRRVQVEPRATFRALSYFTEEVLFSVFRAESGTRMILALAVWRTPLGADAASNGNHSPDPVINECVALAESGARLAAMGGLRATDNPSGTWPSASQNAVLVHQPLDY